MNKENPYTDERTAEKVLAAIENEKLMYKEAAEILGFSPTYLSSIKRTDAFKYVPRKAWEIMHDFIQSGKLLREYKSLIKREVEEAQQPEIPATITVIPAMPKVKYILTRDPEPKKRGPKPDPEKIAAAEKKRKQYEAGREIRIPRPAEINPKTGAVITLEIFADYITIRLPK